MKSQAVVEVRGSGGGLSSKNQNNLASTLRFMTRVLTQCLMLLVALICCEPGFAQGGAVAPPLSGIVAITTPPNAASASGIASVIHVDQRDVYAVTVSDLLSGSSSVTVRLPGSLGIATATVSYVGQCSGANCTKAAVLRFPSSAALMQKLSVLPPALPHRGYPRVKAGDRVSIVATGGAVAAVVQGMGPMYAFTLTPSGPLASSILRGAPVLEDGYVVGYVTAGSESATITAVAQRVLGIMVESAAIPWDTQPPPSLENSPAPVTPEHRSMASPVLDLQAARSDGTVHGGPGFVVAVVDNQLLMLTSGANVAMAIHILARPFAGSPPSVAYPAVTIASEGNESYHLALVGVLVPADFAKKIVPLLPEEDVAELPRPEAPLRVLRIGEMAHRSSVRAG
jgi:hypothetical protein